jgi:signal transduction histidine kinase
VSGSTQQDRPAGLFTCSDTGPGIDPVDLPRVCERSWRGSRWRSADIDPDLSTGEGRATGSVPCVRETAAQTLTAARSGSGLGLAVAKRLAESQRGSVEVDSDGRSGTVVRVALPLANG